MSQVALDLRLGGSIEIVTNPAETFDTHKIESLLPACVSIARSGFGNAAITESDVRLHALEVPFGAYLSIGGEFVGFTSADLLEVSTLPSPVLYLAGTALTRDFQNRGLYRPFVVGRLALGAAFGASYFATRTQSPRVCQSLVEFDPYPLFEHTEAMATAAGEIAEQLYRDHSDFQRPGGLLFDSAAGVQRAAYGHPMYSDLPTTNNPKVEDWFLRHVDHTRGDALIILGTLNPDACEAASESSFGLPFNEVVERLRTLAARG